MQSTITEVTRAGHEEAELLEPNSALSPSIKIRECHRRHPAARVVDAIEEHEEQLKETIVQMKETVENKQALTYDEKLSMTR